jgi:hypothetical protein
MITAIDSRQVFDPRGLTWDYWCASMAGLFAANQLGTVEEERWRDWADGLAGIGRFVGAPDSRLFETWQDWAFALNNSLRR